MQRLLLRGGRIVTMDPAFPDVVDGDVLIEDGCVAAVGEQLDAAGAEVVDVSGKVVTPGFVDSHRHMWQGALRGISADESLGVYFGNLIGTIAPSYGPEDIAAGTLLAAVEALDAGVTTVFDWCNATNSPEHADAAVEALQASGIRGIFGHGRSGDQADVRRLRDRLSDDDARVTLGISMAGAEYTSLEQTSADVKLGRELGIPISMHVGGGAGGPRAKAVTAMAGAGLLGPDVNFTHCCTISDEEVRMLVDAGAGVTVTPVVEAYMGHGTPAFGRFLKAGGTPSVSADVVVAASADLFAQMRTALAVARAASNQEILDAGEDPQTVWPAAADALRAATIWGAKAINRHDRIGSLTPGKHADVVVLDGAGLPREPQRLVGAIATVVDRADVEAVLVGGEFVKRGGRLVNHDLRTLRQLGEAAGRF